MLIKFRCHCSIWVLDDEEENLKLNIEGVKLS